MNMTEIIDAEDQGDFSDWGGSITPPLLDSEDEVIESQCVAPIRKSNLQPHQLPMLESGTDFHYFYPEGGYMSC